MCVCVCVADSNVLTSFWAQMHVHVCAPTCVHRIDFCSNVFFASGAISLGPTGSGPSRFRLLTGWRARQVFIFSPFGRPGVQGRVACRSGPGRASRFAGGHVLTLPSAESGNQLFLSCKGTKAVVRAPHSWPKDLPKVPPPDTIHGGLRFQHMGLGLGGAGRSIQSVAQTLRPSFARREFSGKRPVGLGKCPVTRISRCSVIWNSFTVLKTLCAPPVF